MEDFARKKIQGKSRDRDSKDRKIKRRKSGNRKRQKKIEIRHRRKEK